MDFEKELEKVEVSMEEAAQETTERSPFEIPLDEDDEVREEVIESLGEGVNFEARNNLIDIVEEKNIKDITNDEIDAK